MPVLRAIFSFVCREQIGVAWPQPPLSRLYSEYGAVNTIHDWCRMTSEGITLDVQSQADEVRPHGRRQLRAVDRMIERIALDGNAAGGANEPFQFIARRELGRFRAGVMINLLFHNRAVEVVRPKTQRDLRDARREHDPVRLDMLEIVQHQPRHSDVTQIALARPLRNTPHPVVAP